MPISIKRVLCGMLVAALVLCVAGWRGREAPDANASAGDPTILLSSITVDITVDAPALNHPDLPTFVHLGYGVTQPKALRPESGDVIFYDLSIQPSSQSQTFDASVTDNSKAAALANDLVASPPPDWRTLLFVMQVTPGETSGYWNADTLQMHIPPGAHINSFKMTVAPFTIEKRIVDPLGPPGNGGAVSVQPRVIIAPYSVYRMITNGPVAGIEAYGSPPLGDANCDAAANSIDALFILQRGAGLVTSLPCEKAADVNADGSIDSLDAQLILQFVAGLIPQP